MRPDVPADVMRFAIVPPDTAPIDLEGNSEDLTISPDGTQVVYQSSVRSTNEYLFTRRPIDQIVGAPLRGTDGGAGPFFSPDGQWVGFFAATEAILYKVSILGGPSVTLAEPAHRAHGASWGANDQIIFGTVGAGLFRVSGGGGDTEALTTLDTEQGETSHRWPFIIPGRDAVVFVISAGPTLDSGQLAVLDLESREVTRLGLAGVSPRYVSTGHLLYAGGDRSVRAVAFDARSLEVMGSPVQVIGDVLVKSSGAANFRVSENGRLVYVRGTRGGLRTVVWVDRYGREEAIGAPARRMPTRDSRLMAHGSRSTRGTSSLISGSGIWLARRSTA